MMVLFPIDVPYRRAIPRALNTNLAQVDAKASFVSFLLYIKRVDQRFRVNAVW